MGNAEVKSFASGAEDNTHYLSQFMNLEVLSHGQFLADRWVAFNVEKNKEYQNYFDWSNVQKVAHPEQIEENIRLQENKESLLVGRLPPMISPDLLNPSFFDDVQLPFSPSDVVDFKDLQNKKFLILYKFFYTLQKLRKQDQNPISSIQSTFKGGLPKAAEVGIRSGVHLLISLLREAAKNNQQLSDDTLNFLLELFIDVKPLSLWGTQQIDIVLDKSLHTVADYLEELISSEKTSPISKRKALKVLFSLGLLRGSLPNLLSVVALLRKYNLDVDLTRELKLLQLEKPNTQFNFEKKLKAYTKIFFTSAAGDAQAEKSPYVSMTTDGKYIYLHSELEGLMKIGTGFGYTMFGKVYKHLKDYRTKEKGTLAFVLGKLYYRSGRIAPAPLIELDPDTLEETGIPVHYDTLAPNSIFGELTNPEIEFPIQSNSEQESRGLLDQKSPEQKKLPSAKSVGAGEGNANANQNRSAAQQKRDLRLMRPAQRSPMFTDGRYIYIVSQWTVDSRAGRSGGGDSDDEDEGENVETKQARYGVDIYDPVLDFEHVRAVELFDPNLIESKESNKTRQKAALTAKALDQAIFTTNGSELLVGCPPGTDDSSETRYKFFSLTDGKLRAVNPVKDASHFYNVCYDSYNNVVFSLNDNKKTFDTISCLNNASVAEPVSFPEESDLFVPFENRQIIELASEEVGLADQSDDMHKKEKEEKKKEEMQLLMSVGFHDDTSNYKANDIKFENAENAVNKSTATQLFILANIARLAEGYANLNQQGTSDVANNIRKPYSVHLIGKVFRLLEEFIETYSHNFFEASEEQITDEFMFDQCSFLCTLRIMKYNLAALENYSESLKNIGLKVLNDDFPVKLQKFIWRIFEMKPSENPDYDDIRKALYKEALGILQYALSIIYPDISSVLSLLKTHLKDLNNPLNRDITNAILFWLKSKDHIVKLVAQILESPEYSSLFIKEIKDLVGQVVSWEVSQFCQYLKSCQEWEKLPTYESTELITTSMSFAIEFQKEIQFQLGVKIQDKSLEHTAIHQSSSDLTEVLCKNGILINFELQATLSRLGQKIQDYFEKVEKSGKLEEEDSEKKIPTALLKYKNKLKKKKNKDELILEAYMDTWEQICNVYVEKVYFSQILTYQLNALSLLSSNFLIASKTLKSISGFLTSLNALYDTRKKYDQETKEALATSTMERQLVFESAHPPPKDSSKKEKVSIPGAKELKVVFDSQCELRQHHDWLQFFKDEQCRQLITQRMDRAGTWPKTELIIKGDFFWYNFQKNNFSDSQNWGYKFTVSASFKETLEGDWLTSLHRSTCWLAGKCAGQLINGSALQQAMLQDEEQKYNSLLNSKLFSGGMEKCYFSGGKEGVWAQLGDVINEFQAGHLSEYLVGEISEAEKAEEEFLKDIIYAGRDAQMDKTIEFIQKLFSKEALWANLGGENGSKCVRAAYAVIIKHSGLTNDLKEAMIEVELGIDEKSKISPNIKNLVKKWGAASRMRSWLVERRKDIDDREEKLKQMAQATQKQTAKTAMPKKSTFTKRKAARGRKAQEKSKEAQKEEAKEEVVQMEEHKDEDPITQGGMQVRDTEEIIQRMIDQIVKKAEFLCQLIPSKHWSGDRTEKREKQLLFRTASKKDEEVNKEEEWKRRLTQWKSVRQAKQVYKSLEDESQEIHASLNTSVILCLQSAVSIKRLRKQVESAYLRAICRTIGLNALTSILTGVKSSLFKQDVVGWLCTSLRGTENKLYHFTDNLQGCGHYLESTVNTAFKNVIIAIIKSMSKSDQPEEVNCMLEALKWKYHGDDHVFLAEIDLFGILRGQEDKQLLRKAWGQSTDPKFPGRVEAKLVKNLITLFETVLILCVGKLNWTAADQKPQPKKDKLPSLERHVSAIDEYSVEILIKQAFQVLFAELEEADNNYAKYSGINWRIYNRVKAVSEYQQAKAEKRSKQTDKKKSGEARSSRRARRYNDYEDDDYYDDGYEEDYGGMGGLPPASQNTNAEPKKKQKETYSDEELDPEEEQFLKEMQEEEKSGIEPEEESKTGSKSGKKEEESKEKDKPSEEQEDDDEDRAARKQRRRLLNHLIENEKRILKEMQQRLYNPDFLYRLLALIYKCVTMGSDNVSVVIGNPKYIATLFSLIKHSPSSHQILITKTLQALFQTLPHELFIDSIADLQKKGETEDGYISLKEKEDESSKVLKYFLNLLIDVRRKIYVHAHESQGSFSVSCETTGLIRHLLANPNWGRYVESWLTESIKSSDPLLKQTAFAILGGDLNGLRIGGKIAISTNNRDEIFADNILLKQDLPSNPDYATIVGFTVEYAEKINEEEAKKREKAKPAEKEKWKIRMDIGSAHSNLNPLVLIHSTISKEIPNFSTVELTTVNRFNCVSRDTAPFEPESYELNKNASVLMPVYKWATGEDIPKDTNNLYLRTLAIKSLDAFSKSQENTFLLTSEHQDLVASILNLATQSVVSSQLMNLELTEEKLFRLLQQSCEKGVTLSELPPLCVTMKNKEIEILLGRDLSAARFSIQAGFNIQSIKKYHEMLQIDNPDEFIKRKDLAEYLADKAVLLDGQYVQKYPEIILNAQMVITSNYDLQKFADYYDQVFSQSTKKNEEAKQQEEDRIMFSKEEALPTKESIKLPKCIVLVSDRTFYALNKEFIQQKNKEFKEVFENKDLLTELVEYGFPKDVVEKYLQENPSSAFDIVVNDIVKIIEQEEVAKKGQKKGKGGPQGGSGRGVQLLNSMVAFQQGQIGGGGFNQEFAQPSPFGGQLSKAATKPSKGAVDGDDEESKEGPVKKPEDPETEMEKEKAKKMKMLTGELDDEANPALKKIKEQQREQESGPVIGSGNVPQLDEETKGDGKSPAKSKETQGAEAEEQVIFESEEEGELLGPQDDIDIEKEDANPCFKCQGEKELQNVSESRNRRYDELLAFESMNQIGKIILFKQLNYSLAIFYARRILLNLIEKWSDDKPIFFITDSKYHLKFITFLKLVCNEAMLSSGTFCNNTLILNVRKILESLFTKEANNAEISNFINVLFTESVTKPLEELEKSYLLKPIAKSKAEQPQQGKKGQKKKGSTRRVYTGKDILEFQIDRPSLEHSLLIAHIFLNSDKDHASKRMYRFDVLFQLFGIIPIIRNNRSLLWGAQIFALNMIDKFLNNLSLIDLKAPTNDPNLLLYHPHVVSLHEFFFKLKQREKQDSYSRRTQIISEILINLNRFRAVIGKSHPDAILPIGAAGGKIDVIKYKNIENLADVVDIMQTYPEHRSLVAATWLQVSSDLIKNEQKVIDGDHFYYKNLHSYKITVPHASEVTVKFSEDCQTDTGDSLMFSSDPNGELSAEKVSGNIAKKSLTYSAGTFYLHFPTKGADVVAFGQNDTHNYHHDNSTTGPLCLEEFNCWNTQFIDGSDTHTWILNKQGELWSCGTGSHTALSGSASSKVFTQVKTKDRVKLFSCGSNHSVFVTESNQVYGVGNNQDGKLGLQWNQGGANPTLIDIGKKVIKDLSCGVNHTIMCTVDGQLFGAGSNEFGQLGLNDETGNKMHSINTFRHVTIKDAKVIKVSAGLGFSLILVRQRGKNIVQAAGDKTNGKLGLGDESTNATTFTAIPALENANIVSIHTKRKHSVAVSHSGKVYSWGINDQGQLGHGDFESRSAPKLIEFFKDMKVISAGVGAASTFIVAASKTGEDTKIFAFGNNSHSRLAIKGKEKINKPTPIEFFEDKRPAKVYCGTNHTFVITDPMQIQKIRDTHYFPCNLTGSKTITGPMLVDVLDGNKTYSAIEFEKAGLKSPLSIFVREAIMSREVHWPNYSTFKADEYFEDVKPGPEVDFKLTCSVTGKPITGVCYVNLHLYPNEPQEYLCQEAAFAIPENQVSPTLYYRITRPLKKGKTLPVVPKSQFFPQSETYGYNITITPHYNEKGHDYMMSKYSESFEAFSSDMKNLKPEVDEQLVDMINYLTQKLEKDVFELSENITFPKEEVSLRNAIEKASNDFLKKRFLILKAFNTKFKSLLPYIDFSAKKDATRLRNIYSNASVYIFWDVKSELFEKLLAHDAKPSSNMKVKVNRMKASKFIGKGKPDHTGEFTVFGQIYQYFKTAGFHSFKVAKDQNPFNVGFIGEASIDAGGPYREAVSQMCTELQSGALPLLIPSPNQKNDSGQFREKWVLNPSANSLIHTKMYEFLGALMGCSIRSKNFLNLDLPSMVWKLLVDVSVNRKDLEHIDRYLIQCLDDVINIHKKGVDENSFSEIIQEKFVTTLSDGSEVELIPGGAKTIVTFDTRVEWAELVEKVRLNESKKQAEAIRRGLTLIIPEGVLNLLTWRELETLVCGKPILDVDLLKSNTTYRSCSETDQIIEFFWRALVEFTPEERSMYLRFVWGRSRLPLTSKDFPMKHVVEILRTQNDPDLMLPVAHTCFFQLEIPRYSSYEICRDKLRYAITHCQAIDTDGRAYDIWEEED